MAVLLLGAAAGCGSPDSAGSGGADPTPVEAFVSIPPQRYFVEQVGGEHVRTSVLLPPAASPALYEPEPSELAALSNADVYFAIDVPFERSMAERIRAAGGDDMRWVRTWEDVDRGELSGGKPDPHIWLSPDRVKIQAAAVADALSRVDPAHADAYRANLESFTDRVDKLDADIERTLAPYKGARFMSFHPSWNYFAADYQLELIPIESGGKDPTAGELHELIVRAGRLDIRAVFVQPQFSAEDARTIARQVGAVVRPLDPLAPDWPANMRRVANSLADAFRGSSS